MRWRSSIPDGIAIEPGKISALVDAFAAFGPLPGGGVSRLCASPADGAARDRLTALLREAGAEIRIDPIGNQFGLFRLSGPEGADRPPVMMGSHLDSQARAGRVDGTLGVVAAFEIGCRLMEARRRGHLFARDFCVANWTNEEGARFRPSLLGSGVFTGVHSMATALDSRDDDGIRLSEALAAIGYLGVDPAPPPPFCYLELHAEQGEVLEAANQRIGLVTRNWGAAKLDFLFEGEQAHTGPTPMARRRDALLAAARTICEVRSLAQGRPGQLHTSVGRIVVSPNSSNVVADRVEVTAELRSPDDAILVEAEAAAQAAIRDAAAQAQVDLTLVGRTLRKARDMPRHVVSFLTQCAQAAAQPVMPMETVAGHDALSFIGVRPTGLVFVPSIGGVAHNEAEATRPADMDAGAFLLLEAAFRLCAETAPFSSEVDMELQP